MERSARTARGGSAGGGREAPQAGARRRRPRWEVPYKAAAFPAGQTSGGAAQSAGRTQPPQSVQGDRAHPPDTNLAPPRLLTAAAGLGRVLRRTRDRSFREPLCPGGPRVGAEGAPGGRGMRGPRHGLGGV